MFMFNDYGQQLLDGVKKIHFIGCGGSGMYPLIQILASKGYEISGSDVLDGSIIAAERAMGVQVTLGHDGNNVVGADLVVYSAAISSKNVELAAAASYGIPAVERSILLGYVSRLYQNSICVSGTHGKTTTTAMITTAFELAGRDPSAVIGGKLPLIGGYGKAGNGDEIVIEACEYAETFLKLTPYYSVVLNIDNDHLDYYGSMGELKFAFKRFALMTRFMIFANADDKNTMDVMYTLDRRVRTFGIENGGDYCAVNIQEYKPGFYEFDLREWDVPELAGHIRLTVPGYHNIYNALAMCAVCRSAGLTVEQCAAAAANFKGAGRRFEVYGECNGAMVIDDYAHHPTELRATLATAKKMGYKRVIAVHQPFTYSRTKMLMNDFVDVLKMADVVVITPILGSREVDDGSVSSADLAAKLPGSVLVDSLESAAAWVKQNAHEGDLVLTLGCGDVYKAGKMMVQ
jgi:UDP-N-acetylmuramate--alanine ligase